jgi:glyoxylase-like metal-dependent hydrolase (beta-lactamase superfamily II)
MQIAPGVRRLVAPNPGVMTGPGTNTYLFGQDQVAVLDPGPLIPEHVRAIQLAVAGTIRWIVVTHTHPDHSPAAMALAAATGAMLMGQPPPVSGSQDQSFFPEQVLNDSDRLATDEFTLRAVHTPGHASNHLCYLHEKLNWLFTGDHIMNGSTVVIDPPDGNMNQYLASLRRLKDLGLQRLAPGHGDVLGDPDAVIDWIIDHRLQREAKLIDALNVSGAASAEKLLARVYDDVDAVLHRVALRSLLAHLIKLQEDGRVDDTQDGWALIQ